MTALGFLGITFGKLGCGPGLGGPAGANVAPVLTWITASSDNTPDFTADLTSPIVGDVITLQWASDVGFTSIIGTSPNTVDAGEAGALQVAFTTGSLTNGTYYFRAKHNSSAWSNIVTVTIAVTSGGGSLYYWLGI